MSSWSTSTYHNRNNGSTYKPRARSIAERSNDCRLPYGVVKGSRVDSLGSGEPTSVNDTTSMPHLQEPCETRSAARHHGL
jgi:hypothetical protein